MRKSNYGSQIFSNKTNVLNLIDFCKGLAIIGVVLTHYRLHLRGWFGWQGVHIFIILSAFTLTYSCLNKNPNSDGKQWYIKRAERISPSYWLVVLIGFFMTVGLGIFNNVSRSIDLITFLLKAVGGTIKLLCI